MKKPKIQTPEWVLKGYNSEKEYLGKTGKKKPTSGKMFKIRKCPKCKSGDVKVVLTGKEGSEEDDSTTSSEENRPSVADLKHSQSKGKGEWECRKCKWKGNDIVEEEVSEDDFLKYLDEIGDDK